MALPTRETVQKLLASGYGVRDRILRIARSLESLKEYDSEQALMVAADIVSHSLKAKTTAPLLETNKGVDAGGASAAY